MVRLAHECDGFLAVRFELRCYWYAERIQPDSVRLVDTRPQIELELFIQLRNRISDSPELTCRNRVRGGISDAMGPLEVVRFISWAELVTKRWTKNTRPVGGQAVE